MTQWLLGVGNLNPFLGPPRCKTVIYPKLNLRPYCNWMYGIWRWWHGGNLRFLSCSSKQNRRIKSQIGKVQTSWIPRHFRGRVLRTLLGIPRKRRWNRTNSDVILGFYSISDQRNSDQFPILKYWKVSIYLSRRISGVGCKTNTILV